MAFSIVEQVCKNVKRWHGGDQRERWVGSWLLALNKPLGLPDSPTAVFCYNDMTALGVLRSIHMHGLRVPADISLIGFDDLFFVSYTEPQLTAVRQPMRRMGRMAMESLLKLMSGQPSAEAIKSPAELIVRESTAAPRVDPP